MRKYIYTYRTFVFSFSSKKTTLKDIDIIYRKLEKCVINDVIRHSIFTGEELFTSSP